MFGLFASYFFPENTEVVKGASILQMRLVDQS